MATSGMKSRGLSLGCKILVSVHDIATVMVGPYIICIPSNVDLELLFSTIDNRLVERLDLVDVQVTHNRRQLGVVPDLAIRCSSIMIRVIVLRVLGR